MTSRFLLNTTIGLVGVFDAAEAWFGVPRHTEDLAWFKKCHFQVTPEIDKTLKVKGFLVLGVTLI
jgi:hypothetical protein